MPHRVANFFRSSAHSLEIQLPNPKRNTNKSKGNSTANTTRRRPSPRRTGVTLINPDQLLSYTSAPSTTSTTSLTDDDADNAQAPPYPACEESAMDHSRHTGHSELHKDLHHHRKLTFPALHLGRSGKDGHQHSHVTLDWKLESPPIVFYGDAENSSGALVSGQLLLDVTREGGLEVDSFYATLSVHVSQKKPYTVHCSDCVCQVTQLRKWTFVERPLFMAKGLHTFPFSVLLEGHLPTTMDGPLTSISYQFKAEAFPKKVAGTSLPPVKLEKVLDVKRSLPEPDLPHHSIRIFPPTNIKAIVHYPQVIHPIGSNTFSLRLDGIARQNDKANAIEYWKLKKLTWRLEETAKSLAQACTKHAHAGEPASDQQGQPTCKGTQRADTRVIGEKTIFGGWKSHYNSVTDSSVELELDYALSRHAKYSCNTAQDSSASSPAAGVQVTHQLMIEMVVSQEMAPIHKPSHSAPTGVGRILRMHFGTVLTERGGIGISWDNEAPPIYQDVPPSPPAYSAEHMGHIDEVIEPLDGVSASGSGSSRRQSTDAMTASLSGRSSTTGDR